MDIVREYDSWRARFATANDNARLCEILREVDMQADIHVTEERDPDFFAIHALHLGTPYTLVIEDKSGQFKDEQAIVGFCTAIVRDGFIDGVVRRVAYVCDLRLVAGYRNQRILPRACREFFDFLAREMQVDAFYSASLQANKGAVAARRFSGGHVMCEFDMVNLPLVRRPKPPRHIVIKATKQDQSELSAFLHRQSLTRQFGYRFDQQQLTSRSEVWPGLRVDDFYIIRNSAGDIVACAAPWSTETGSLRCTRVLGYYGGMKWLRILYNVEATLRRFKRLPRPGEIFRQISLTHLEVFNDDPQLFNSLLQAIFNDFRYRDLHFINVMMPVGSPMSAGLRGFRAQAVRFDLNCFLPPASTFHGQLFKTLRPGFEMAIH